MTGGLLIAGTTSDAGKSLITAGLCRVLARQGVRVAPFKSQNMSNNSMVVAGSDGGAEIGRAQWLQALAAGVVPSPLMNPVLLKPGSDLTSHIVVCGKPFGDVHAHHWHDVRARLREAAFAALDELRNQYDVVVAEGAGSPAEVNLRATDFTNMGLARHTGWPVVVVGDIDRGGMLAACYGTVAIMDPADQALIAGWVVNKFRGSMPLLQPGLDQLESLTGRPVLGTVPYLRDMWLDAEDSLSAAHVAPLTAGAGSPTTLKIGVVDFPRVSNLTDVDALAHEPGVTVGMITTADQVAHADVIVLPGSRRTVEDLTWMRDRGIAQAVQQRAIGGVTVLGICGGYQMLGHEIADGVESDVARANGLGLLPVDVSFHAEKVLTTPSGRWRNIPVGGYEIHHGRTIPRARTAVEPFPGGVQCQNIWGTMWHGAFEHDEFRRAWLAQAAQTAGTSWEPTTGVSFAGQRLAMLDRIADAICESVDVGALTELITSGVPRHLPTRMPGLVSP